jgi:hypothetical protein
VYGPDDAPFASWTNLAPGKGQRAHEVWLGETSTIKTARSDKRK